MTPPLGTRGLTEGFEYGRGYDEIIFGASPAAGANYIYRIDGQYTTRILSAVFTLATDSNVANRAVTLDYCDPEGRVWLSNGLGVVFPASGSVGFSGQIDRSHGEFVAGSKAFFPIADAFIDPGNSIRINVAAKQAGDQLSAITLLVERFPTGNRGYPQGAVENRRRRR